MVQHVAIITSRPTIINVSLHSRCYRVNLTSFTTVLLKALSNPDGSQPTKSYKVKSQAELDALLEDPTFLKRETIQLIELIMPRDDVPRALKTQAALVSDS